MKSEDVLCSSCRDEIEQSSLANESFSVTIRENPFPGRATSFSVPYSPKKAILEENTAGIVSEGLSPRNEQFNVR
jgi:hypothetical protein